MVATEVKIDGEDLLIMKRATSWRARRPRGSKKKAA